MTGGCIEVDYIMPVPVMRPAVLFFFESAFITRCMYVRTKTRAGCGYRLAG